MKDRLFCEYRFKFYLNASHSILINGRQGAVHPHTWEFTLDILVPRNEFKEFNSYEQSPADFFAQYQNITINDLSPFDTIVPTLENMVEYFGDELRKIIRNDGGELLMIEGSETPTRSYIISYDRRSDYMDPIEDNSKVALDKMLEKMLDDILA